MPVIHLETSIQAPRERVFDLARSIDAHQDTAGTSGEKAVAGTTNGLLGLDGEVTWEARHFAVKQRLKVRMTQLDRPLHFQDVMVQGAFARMIHDHSFDVRRHRTVMIDRFEFSAPLGPLGRMAEFLFLTAHLRSFLEERNGVLKRIAESDEWRKYLRTG